MYLKKVGSVYKDIQITITILITAEILMAKGVSSFRRAASPATVVDSYGRNNQPHLFQHPTSHVYMDGGVPVSDKKNGRRGRIF